MYILVDWQEAEALPCPIITNEADEGQGGNLTTTDTYATETNTSPCRKDDQTPIHPTFYTQLRAARRLG